MSWVVLLDTIKTTHKKVSFSSSMCWSRCQHPAEESLPPEREVRATTLLVQSCTYYSTCTILYGFLIQVGFADEDTITYDYLLSNGTIVQSLLSIRGSRCRMTVEPPLLFDKSEEEVEHKSENMI